MSLSLGKVFNRSYNLRLPFLNGYYNIEIFYHKHSSFVLFQVNPDFNSIDKYEHSAKVAMFKNLDASKFCETFLDLHTYKKETLDIINQFQSIKPDYTLDVNFILNETVHLSKTTYEDRVFYDTLTVYGFTISSFSNEFIFLLVERQNINSKLNKKIVRTSALQISTSPSLDALSEFYNESKQCRKPNIKDRSNIVITFGEDKDV
jgi:hypothetical protein